MTDKQDRRTERGLRSPANDGAPRPKPPRPWPKAGPPPDTVDVRAAKLASRCGTEMVNGRSPAPILMAALATEHDQGELDGLRRAAKAICYHCEHPITGTSHPGRWPVGTSHCRQ
jgi:hypothetical protein